MESNFWEKSLTVGCIAGVTLLSGCVGAGVSTGLELGTTHVNNFGNGPKAQKVDSSTEKTIQPVEKTAQVIILDNQKELLRLKFQAEGQSADERALAGKIIEQTAGEIGSDDAIVGRKGGQDLIMTIRPDLIIIDKDQEYYRMNCNIRMSLKSAVSSRIFGAKQIKLVSKKRRLGKNAAIEQFNDAAVKAASEWCRTQLRHIADNELGGTVLTIQLPSSGKEARDAEKDAAYIREIGEDLGKMPNFVSYEFMGSDAEKGTCQYRIVYFKSAYPNGVANELSTLLKTVVRH